MKAIRVIIILIAITLSGCEDVIQIKLDEGSKLYVIDAFINDLREKQVVRVTNNDSYFSNREAPPVAGAQVTLTDLSLNIAYTFTYAGNGNYTYDIGPNDTIAFVNHQYKLEVNISGDNYTSIMTQKRPAKIDSISAILDDGGGFGPPPTEENYYCFLFAKDKADNNPDYYWIKTFRNDTLFSQSLDLNICIDGTGGAVYNASQDSINFTAPSTFLGFKSYKKGDKCKVQIHSVAKETYFFFVQAYNQINNGGLFATTPENVKTNIITPNGAKLKAVGRFDIASVVESTKTIN